MYILLRMVTFFMMEVLLKTNNMKISELIKKLQEIQKEDGDLDVRVVHDGFEESIGKMEFYTDRHILYIE